jgi:L-lactate utilization protein LutB
MNLDEVIKTLELEISKQRSHVYLAGDKADVVYIGEEIGKLQTAIKIIKIYKEDNEN